MRSRILISLFTSLILLFNIYSAEAEQTIRILTAGRTGEYYKAATELDKVLSNFKLDVLESPGSFYNIAKVGTAKTDMALAQFDAIMLYILMARKKKKFTKIANNCEVVAPLNYEFIHIIVNKNSKFTSIQDLKGKKIAVGPKNSGSWVSAFLILSTENRVKFKGNRNLLQLPYERALSEVASGQIDAMFITISMGAKLLKNVSSSVAGNLKLLSLGEDFRFSSVAVKKYYINKKIPGGTYPWQSGDVYTVATPSFLLAYKYLDQDMVKKFTSQIFGKADLLNKKSKLWKFLDIHLAKKQIKNHVPYHMGSKKFLLK